MNTPIKYRKKPVVIEAMRVTPTNVRDVVRDLFVAAGIDVTS